MTQQGDARNPAQTEQTTFLSQGSTGTGSESGSYSRNEQSDDNKHDSTSNDTIWGRWPSLMSIRQVTTAFLLEAATNAKPLREKLDAWVLYLWTSYIKLVEAYPLITIFLSCFLFFSAGPIIVFACVTGVSLGIMVSIAAIIILILQSIVVSIAGGVLLLILGTIFVLTLFGFFWAVAGFMGFKLLRNFVKTMQEQRRNHYRQQMKERHNQQSTARVEKASSGSNAEDDEFAEFEL
ncbi:hypothetical protein BGZ83_001694 [Gryganskiella cystojenkinii]|nr:hypothetical protein BGZ83_001694 [Gryganskiella cystojenkinii]